MHRPWALFREGTVYIYICKCTAPQPFESELMDEVTFPRDGSPLFLIRFEVRRFLRAREGGGEMERDS